MWYNEYMNNEIEAQFLEIDKDEMRKKLKGLGAKCEKPETKMKRVVFNTGVGSFARVRDEGAGKIVMTYKNVTDDNSILGTKEVNITVDNYENAVTFLKSIGLEPKAEQETYREIWTLGDAEITIDTWPWLPTFMEIEAPSEEGVWEAAGKLGFSRNDAVFGSVDTKYQHYYGVEPDVVNFHTPKITFDMDSPEWAKNMVI